MDHDGANPFQILGLPTSASNAEIVERGQDLSDAAPTQDERRLYRWAIEQLITKQSTRLVHELFEVPGADYEDPEWEGFARSFARNPVNLSELVRNSAEVGPEDFDVLGLIDLVLDGLLEVSALDSEAALLEPPVEADCGPPPLEVRDVLFG